VELDRYSREHRHFAVDWLPPLLNEVARPGVIADLGCGEGAILAALWRRGLVEESFAVDLSPERTAVARQAVPGTIGVVADATATGLPEASVDGVVCSQLIEHLPDDRELAPEIARILRPGGWWYIGSVLRRQRAWWFYNVDGVRRLDPTHVREYASVGDLEAALGESGLCVERRRVGHFRFPISDLALRALARFGVISQKQSAGFYRRHPALERLRWLAIHPPGYRLVELAGSRQHQPRRER